jgi:predicted small secreted protein
MRRTATLALFGLMVLFAGSALSLANCNTTSGDGTTVVAQACITGDCWVSCPCW